MRDLLIEGASTMDVQINQSHSSPTENEQQNTLSSFSDDNDKILMLTNDTPCKSPIDISENCEMSPVASVNNTFEMIIEYLSNNDNVLCKSQQRDEEDINKEEKRKILLEIFEKSKSNFLLRFGQFLNAEQAKVFEQFRDDPKDGYEVVFHLRSISQTNSKKKRHRHLRNKRYAALKRLEKESYFSETEMMNRNPLLYEQLVGQYLTTKEKRFRDYRSDKPMTFVGALMNGIEKEQNEVKRKEQEEAEDAAMEEDDSEDYDDSSSSDTDEVNDPKPSTSKKKQKKPPQMLWGEFENVSKKIRPQPKSSNGLISAQERNLLKEEFVSIMYQSFLDGEDDDFDYNTVDNNEEYDNIEILEHDEEEKYFDSEEPEDLTMGEDNSTNIKQNSSSEDELDMYMNALNQHPAVCELSEHIKKL